MKGYTPIKQLSINILKLVSIGFALLLFLFPPFALSADDSSDRPDWAGTPGRSDEKPGRGNNQPGVSKGDLYGDLLIIVRDDNGEPVKYTWDWDELDATLYVPQQDDNGCFQPIANEQAVDPITGEPLPALPDEFQMLIPLNSDCEIVESLEGYEGYDFASYGEEVDFGRLSVARSPADVIEASYKEAMSNINNAISLRTDPAGRIEVEVTENVFKTIDSPLENLALYKELMLNGYLPGLTLSIDQLGDLSHLLAKGNDDGIKELTPEDLHTAAALLAGAGDKFGYITLDLVININTILGINDVNRNDSNLNENGYFDFSLYSYDREDAYGEKQVGLLLPGKVPSTDPDNPVMISSLKYQSVSLLDTGVNPKAFTDGQEETEFARGFTQAADDSLRVINYIHNWGLPDLPEGFEWTEWTEWTECSEVNIEE
ncbi:hypothetical protein FC650_15340 [Vibrio natriegens]|uniref:hypothetical protein n=1 Tax=Vibrio natriegens TaxID=691 RepID=UPI0015930981|nr:hypothetical protein [Vibrio natriegens]NVC94990.1 hypothetical protein [Vibrio natriegens]